MLNLFGKKASWSYTNKLLINPKIVHFIKKIYTKVNKNKSNKINYGDLENNYFTKVIAIFSLCKFIETP